MSSPARSTVSATSAGQGGSSSIATLADENSPRHSHTDRISAQECKEDALLALSVLKSEVMAALQKEVKALDEDSWKFAGPRSQIHLLTRPGPRPFKQREATKE
ncbi:protein SAMBA [Aristolochia californica]|uniref:protein SAMBA n=1 Tax=Aristolochia californica TaxID=171875 RepID=UPI0035DF280A